MSDQEFALRLHSVTADMVRSIWIDVSREAQAGGPEEKDASAKSGEQLALIKVKENATVRKVALLLELDYQFSFFALKLDEETSVLNLSRLKTWYEYY